MSTLVSPVDSSPALHCSQFLFVIYRKWFQNGRRPNMPCNALEFGLIRFVEPLIVSARKVTCNGIWGWWLLIYINNGNLLFGWKGIWGYLKEKVERRLVSCGIHLGCLCGPWFWMNIEIYYSFCWTWIRRRLLLTFCFWGLGYKLCRLAIFVSFQPILALFVYGFTSRAVSIFHLNCHIVQSFTLSIDTTLHAYPKPAYW